MFLTTTAELAEQLGGEVLGDPAIQLTGFAPANAAKPGDLTFAENEMYFKSADDSAAAAVLIDKHFGITKKTLIKVPNARIAFAKVLPLFFPEPKYLAGIAATAMVAKSAQVDPTAHIGPHCVVGENVKIGAGAILQGGNHVASDCVIGDGSHLFPNVVLYGNTHLGHRVRIHSGSVIGSDGFGYVLDSGVHRKVPQIGGVVIGDDVEIGANTTIDRGALGPTTIGKGTKIDNLVQIAHNVVIGENCLIVAQVGIAGSTRVGNYTTLAGQVGVAGHLKIGSKVVVAGQSGIIGNISDGEKVWGTPAIPDRQEKRQIIAIQQLPDLIRRVAELEKLVAGQKEG
ncbi:MAG: UDP-3-O-(3-hydroxymyristoyl)glucosamine N-acyltransferase [Verrucomicrobia bacterium]|jgi:UDP-3-O-[3-hydroxymyristoyl] glucosamine N-acyltransferase|nr:UDP-3-O-(3-hydroxymyristoyl)glucosamine N-acyltransferase [Verrucomicrobiota bacterium]